MQHAPVPIATFAQLLGTVNDGRLQVGLSAEMRAGLEEMNRREARYGGKQKMSIVVKIDFETKDGVAEIRGDYAVKMPKEPRPKTILWQTGDGRLSTANPRQTEMFATIDGGGSAPPVHQNTEAAPATVAVVAGAAPASVVAPQAGGDD